MPALALTRAIEGSLPFTYMSTGIETRFTNALDPDPRSRAGLLVSPARDARRVARRAYAKRRRADAAPPATADCRALAIVDSLAGEGSGAIRNLEESLADNRPRALIQMATGSGKTLLAAFVRLPAHSSSPTRGGSCSSSTGRTSAARR